jgi:hypothetical protein
MMESEGIEITVRKIQGFREWWRGALDAWKINPAWDEGMAPQDKERGGQPGCPPARGTRTLRRYSFNARNRGSTRLPPPKRKEFGRDGWGG